MSLILAAVTLGCLAGVILGGGVRRLGDAPLRWWPLAFLGLGLQLIPISPSLAGMGRWLGPGLLVASYAGLFVFLAMNLRIPGMALIALGFAMNVLVIGLNGGMPVDDGALREAAGSRYPESRRDLVLHGGAKHHLARPDDVLLPMADVIPIGGPFRQVISVGDVVWLLGTAWVVASATLGYAARPGSPGGDGGPSS